MAPPDLNSVPSSPHALAIRRQSSSQTMPPPPVPPSPSLNILPSNQHAVNQATGAAASSSSSLISSPQLPAVATVALPMQDNTGVGPGPGPLRHPRPLTAAELHLQLEKEQEAVVNRLTRELSLLRAAHNASVVSNASSTSASAVIDSTPAPDLISGSGFSIPSSTGRQHHRTSSNASNRSHSAQLGTSLGATSSMAAGPLPAPGGRAGLSRQNSTTSRRSRASSPVPPHLHQLPYPHPHPHTGGDPALGSGYFYRSQPHPHPAVHATPPLSSELSPGLMPATSRYEEVAQYRSELDAAKRENEVLRRRIRELERAVRDRRASDASARARSESVSTTASVAAVATPSSTGAVAGASTSNTPNVVGSGATIAGRREGSHGGGRDRVVSVTSAAGSIATGVPEDEVRVGESAASSGLGIRSRPAPDTAGGGGGGPPVGAGGAAGTVSS